MSLNPEAQPFSVVVQAELDDISRRRATRGEPEIAAEADWTARADRARLFGISASGGGIRSATFSLGVLQGLVEKGLLPRADYLSTVSGGGYIGSWLQGVLARAGQGHDAFAAVAPSAPESGVIQFLRKYSNYLAARPGLSLDSAVIAIIWLRNTVLNQAIIMAAAFAAMLACLAPGRWLLMARDTGVAGSLIILALGVVAGTIAVITIVRNLYPATKRESDPNVDDRGSNPPLVGMLVILPVVLSAALLVFGLVHVSHFPLTTRFWQVVGAFVLFALHMLLQQAGGFPRCYRKTHCGPALVWRSSGHVLWMSALSASLTFGLLWAVTLLLKWLNPGTIYGSYAAIAWVPPLLLASFICGVSLHIGLMGKDFPDSGREWFARSGAWVAACAVGWAALFTIGIFAPLWVAKLWVSPPVVITAVVSWIGSTIAGVLAGKSAKTGGNGVSRSRVIDFIARYAPLLAIPGFSIAIAFAVHAALHVLYPQPFPPSLQHAGLPAVFVGEYWDKLMFPKPLYAWTLEATAIAVFLLLSVRVNINEFSMHHFYKNRLVRCYLGASAAGWRNANRFTGFDPQDDTSLWSLRCERDQPKPGPYPIVNATLTVTQGTELATQERKAKPWIFTPRYSGFEPSHAEEHADTPANLSADGYVPTNEILGGNLRLGTAMAISGAALNPNQGFHTATQVAFLMTLFNVRLGWWTGNPRDGAKYGRPGPRVALWPLIRELFGWTNERAPYLNLSDGGNFENLGLYELVRRRCRFIIAIDAEQDQNFVFEGLGGAVRKCRADFGVQIDINPRPIQPVNGFSGAHCAVGRIWYPNPAQNGWLFYLKASITGDEAADVEEYRREHPEFPQQSTANQFFSESQFESYRRLGLHVVRSGIDFMPGPDLDAVFSRLADHWETPPTAPVGTSRHAEAYTNLLHTWKAAVPSLESFDPDIVADKPEAFASGAGRIRYFLLLQMIQLMQDVFVAYDFGQSQTREHPSNSGWMNVFRYWTSRPELREVWLTQRMNFGSSFRHFVDDLIENAQIPDSQRT
ncbi:MAG: hypothetical protein JOY54_17205 [Acidobacteriaceae bacterium]|nr:hypothetical protein [Acidobacteriaceae bacterium]